MEAKKGKNQRANGKSKNDRRAFTLVELLAVSGVLTLLLAVLLPAAQRAGRCAKAAACQSQLRQWGLLFTAFVADSERQGFGLVCDWLPFYIRNGDGQRRTLRLCPMATQFRLDRTVFHWESLESSHCGLGGKFTAWKLPSSDPGATTPSPVLGSYGVNGQGLDSMDGLWTRFSGVRPCRASGVPLMLDGAFWHLRSDPRDQPPEYDGDLTARGMKDSCLDRHAGGINSVFLDGSVRKVGLKELWTLRWSPSFDIRGPWTRAGGIQPEDWPAWMRAFKDY